MKWFKNKPTFVPLILEVPPPTPLPESREVASSIASLEAHAGFRFLRDKLALQAARLRAELVSARHEDLRSVYFLQSGIHWCAWLQSQLDFYKAQSQTRNPTSFEAQALEDITTSIELVGATSPI